MTNLNTKPKTANQRRKLAQVLLLCAAVFAFVGAGDPASRFNDIGHQMMCICGCNQILLECNHVGCPSSDGMRNELMAAVSRGDSDSLVEQSFVQKYGPTVLAAPWLTKFNIVAWVVPPTLLLLGLGGTFLLVRKWRLRTVPMPYVAQDTQSQEIRDRIRRETEL